MFNKKSDNETKLRAALAKADEVLNERNKIEAAIQKTASEIAAAEADLQKALERLAVEEAAVALADAMVESRQTPAQRVLWSNSGCAWKHSKRACGALNTERWATKTGFVPHWIVLRSR